MFLLFALQSNSLFKVEREEGKIIWSLKFEVPYVQSVL